EDGQGRRADVLERLDEVAELDVVEAGNDALEHLVLEDLDVGEHLPAGVGASHEHDPAVVGDPDPLDEAALLEPVDDARRVRERDVEHVGEAAHRHLAMALEHRHDVEVGEARVGPAHAIAAHAAQLPERCAQLGDDRLAQSLAVENTSHVPKYSTQPNDDVNGNRSRTAEEPMRFALMIEAQQGMTYDDQLAIARRAEAAGFESFFRSDHYAGFPGDGEGPTTDAWAILAGLARGTGRIC